MYAYDEMEMYIFFPVYDYIYTSPLIGFNNMRKFKTDQSLLFLWRMKWLGNDWPVLKLRMLLNPISGDI